MNGTSSLSQHQTFIRTAAFTIALFINHVHTDRTVRARRELAGECRGLAACYARGVELRRDLVSTGANVPCKVVVRG